MLLGIGRAPGKVILFGEHAVVYGRPALAAPVTQVGVEVRVEQGAAGEGTRIAAADVGDRIALRDAPIAQPLALAARLTLARLGLDEPDWAVSVHSTIPIAAGLGSGAAVSVALARALAAAAGRRIDNEALSAIAFEVEKLHHGTPSGVDNTVIATERPVYFVPGSAPTLAIVGRPFALAIADSGIVSPTRGAVAAVRTAWAADRDRCEAVFDRIAEVVEAARAALAAGSPESMGPLMDRNHGLLREIGVSCPELDALVAAARAAGALGAKLSGGGRGGNAIALVTAESAGRVAEALHAAGAAGVILTQVAATAEENVAERGSHGRA